jgi:hypothetical protein
MGRFNRARSPVSNDVKQLKAYLLFYDQILANYFSQLENAAALFNVHAFPNKTYFTQTPNDIYHLESLLKNPNNYGKNLQTFVESDDIFETRRRKALDHLLARFGEIFTDYTLLKYKNESKDTLHKNKIAFLQQYDKLSQNRYRSFDYTKQENECDTIIIKKRLNCLLDLKDEDYFIIEHILLRPPSQSLLSGADLYSSQISFLFNKGSTDERFKDINFQKVIEQTIARELPAHLTIYVHWLAEEKMSKIKEEYWNYIHILYPIVHETKSTENEKEAASEAWKKAPAVLELLELMTPTAI